MKIEYNKSKPHAQVLEEIPQGKFKQTVRYILFSHPHYEKIEESKKIYIYK